MAEFIEVEAFGNVYEFPTGTPQETIQQVMDEQTDIMQGKNLADVVSDKFILPDEGGENVEDVIREAAGAVGVDEQTMLAIAAAESSLDPKVKNKKTTASGLYQFVDKTWDDVVKKHGKRHKVLPQDRLDARANALMGAELLAENAKTLREDLGREPTANELYLAHFLGIGDARKALKLAAKNPDAPAAGAFRKEVAASNPAIFTKDATISEVIGLLTRRLDRQMQRFAASEEQGA